MKGVTLNSQTCPCFAFIAPVHFHNALKPLQRRRHGEKEKKSVEERDPGHREIKWDRNEDKKHSQSNLKLLDVVWGCEGNKIRMKGAEE